MCGRIHDPVANRTNVGQLLIVPTMRARKRRQGLDGVQRTVHVHSLGRDVVLHQLATAHE